MGDSLRRPSSSPTFDAATFATLEDLFSIDGTGQSPTSPLSHDGVDPLTSTSGSAFASPSVYAPSNAVHMEIQENSKLPTFTWAVDRSNSGPEISLNRRSSGQYSPATKHDLEEMLRLSENDASLTEMFLKSSDRSSRNLNYGAAGALRGGGGDKAHEHETTRPPTKRSGVSSFTLAGSNSANGLTTPPSSPTSFKPLMSPQSPFPLSPTLMANSCYPYGRRHPLPIPKAASPEHAAKKPPATPLQEALKTAAAIASNGPNATPTLGRSVISKDSRNGFAELKNAPMGDIGSSSTQQPELEGPRKPSALVSNQADKSTLAGLSDINSRQKSPSESIREATKRRSQFGFGENHVVPSVPLPPPKKPTTNRAPPTHSMPRGPTIPMLSHHSNNSTVAYERKKQRAKDARIKLNDAIDRLSVAINVAGTQTRQRATQIRSLVQPLASGLSRQNMLHVMDACVEESDNAKKWDRPSFVGSAAAIVQSLNAQCEALTRELLMWKIQASGSQRSCVVPTSSNSASKRKKPAVVDPAAVSAAEVTAKRQRFESDETDTTATPCVSDVPTEDGERTFASIDSQSRVLKRIASFLEPRSLLRCLQVSKSWSELNVFQSDDVWLDDAIRRFGSFNVRQWKVKHDDNDKELASCPIKLYKAMDSGNVRPYNRQEGSLFLGEARMSRKVSAWAFMVERSNGETFRSVKKESTGGSGQYSSLPVIELRILIQNTGMTDSVVVVKDQAITVDSSTRRRGEEMNEIWWDDRLRRSVLNLNGTPRHRTHEPDSHEVGGELCRLRLYDAVVLVSHVHAKGCSTTSKFQHKANYTKVLVTLNGTTLPLVIPFFRDTTVV